MLANGRSQFLLDRLGRCLKLFVSTGSPSYHEFSSQFGLAILYTRKNPKNDRNNSKDHWLPDSIGMRLSKQVVDAPCWNGGLI